jgi:hypothetical protein
MFKTELRLHGVMLGLNVFKSKGQVRRTYNIFLPYFVEF